MPDIGNKHSSADWAALMPKQTIPAANLLTPPLGAAAVVSALGLGMASQIWGFWAGAMAGALDMNTKLMPVAKDHRTARPQATADIDALKTIIRRKAGTVSAKTASIPAKEAKVPIAAKASAQAAAIDTLTALDDLKRISGIGPKLEQVLNGMGIRSYAQIAAWTAEDIARIDDQLKFGGRISRDDWVGQASVLIGQGQK